MDSSGENIDKSVSTHVDHIPIIWIAPNKTQHSTNNWHAWSGSKYLESNQMNRKNWDESTAHEDEPPKLFPNSANRRISLIY